ncbi:TIGR04222 domain-containing membrane protein [Streptomyces sp. LARHCF249]
MRWLFRWLARGSGGGIGPLDVYEVAFLAGGAERVADSVIIELNRRGLLVVHERWVRAVGGKRPPGHAVERAVVAFCRRGKTIEAVRAAMRRFPEVEEIIGGRLAARGLVAGAGRRVTRRGRRKLRVAGRDASVPAYVFSGITVAPDGPEQPRARQGSPGGSRGGRSRRRTGGGFDGGSGSDWGTGTHFGGHSSGGGGGGGGGGGE